MRTYYRAADRSPTWTSKVLAALRELDDLVDRPTICRLTGANCNQVSAALHHLERNARAVARVEEDGKPYYMLTGEDVRPRTVEARVPEPPGNRTRRRRSSERPTSHGVPLTES